MAGRLPRHELRRLPRAAAVAAVLLPAGEASAAVAQRLSLAVSGGGGYGTNPFLSTSDDAGAGFVELSLAPRYDLIEARGTAVFEGSLRGTRYLSRYGSSFAYGGRMSAQRQLSETTEIRGGLSIDSAIVGERRALGRAAPTPSVAPADALDEPAAEPLVEPLAVGDLADPIDPDLGLIDNEQRRTQIAGYAGISFRPGLDDTVALDIAAARSGFPGAGDASNYRSLSTTASYSRRLSDTAALGISAAVQHTRFSDRLGSSLVYQPQLTYSGRMIDGWSYNLAAGAVVIRSSAPDLPTRQSTGFSGSVGVCRQQLRTSFCFGASRGAQESGRGEVGERTSAFAQLSYRLSEHENVRLSAAVARADQALRGLVETTRQVVADASYRRQLRERLDIGASAGYRDVYGIDRAVSGDFRGQVSLSMRFGR